MTYPPSPPRSERITDHVIELIGVNPVQAQELAEGLCPVPSVTDYPQTEATMRARLFRDSLGIDNFVPVFGMFLISRCADALVVGDIGFHTPPDARGSCEIGYGLAPSARHQGFARRAVRLLSDYGFAQSSLSSIIGETNVDNVASMRVLESCGFIRIASAGDRVRYRLLRHV